MHVKWTRERLERGPHSNSRRGGETYHSPRVGSFILESPSSREGVAQGVGPCGGRAGAGVVRGEPGRVSRRCGHRAGRAGAGVSTGVPGRVSSGRGVGAGESRGRGPPRPTLVEADSGAAGPQGLSREAPLSKVEMEISPPGPDACPKRDTCSCPFTSHL